MKTEAVKCTPSNIMRNGLAGSRWVTGSVGAACHETKPQDSSTPEDTFLFETRLPSVVRPEVGVLKQWGSTEVEIWVVKKKKVKWTDSLSPQSKIMVYSSFYSSHLDKTHTNSLISLINIWHWRLSLIMGNTAAIKRKKVLCQTPTRLCWSVCTETKQRNSLMFWIFPFLNFW